MKVARSHTSASRQGVPPMHRRSLFLLALVALVLLVGATGILVSTTPGTSSGNRVDSVAVAAETPTHPVDPAAPIAAFRPRPTTTTTTAPAPPPITAAPKPKPAPVKPKATPAPRAVAPAVGAGRWDQLAYCESGGNWATHTANGFSGGLQFADSTWRSFGGTAYAPMAWQASREAQIAVAEKVLASAGWVAWPACSRKLGWR